MRDDFLDAEADLVVAYIVERFPDRSEPAVTRQLDRLHRSGADVRVLAIGDRAGDVIAHPLAAGQIWRRPGYADPRLWARAKLSTFTGPRRALRVARAARRIARRERSRLEALRLAALAIDVAAHRWLDKRTVLHAHGAGAAATFGFLLAEATGLRWGFRATTRDVYARRLALATKAASARHVLSSSRPVAHDLRSRLPLGRRQRVHTVHCGIEVPSELPTRHPPGPGDPPQLLAVGDLTPKQGFDLLIDACATLVTSGLKLHCDIIGSGPERERLEGRIRSHRLEARVRLLPPRPLDELEAEYSTASLMIVPGTVDADGDRDDLPEPMLEAMARGVPVVASDLPAIAELFAGAALLAPPGDLRALADTLRAALGAPERGHELAAAARAIIERQFDVRTTTDELARILGAS